MEIDNLSHEELAEKLIFSSLLSEKQVRSLIFSLIQQRSLIETGKGAEINNFTLVFKRVMEKIKKKEFLAVAIDDFTNHFSKGELKILIDVFTDKIYQKYEDSSEVLKAPIFRDLSNLISEEYRLGNNPVMS